MPRVARNIIPEFVGNLSLSWFENAECRKPENEHLDFFPEKNLTQVPQKLVCSECEVRQECLDFAIETRQDLGIWGGFNAKERDNMRKRGKYRVGMQAPKINLGRGRRE